MSNIAFDFLTESFLFNESASNYAKRTIDELDKELQKYQKYILNHLTEINAEVYKEYNFIQPLSNKRILPSKEDLLHGCIFLDTYLIDDPIFKFNIKQMKFADVERISMGMEKLSDDEIKGELSSYAEYMKSLTTGVNVENGYIKFYPFSLWLQPVFNPVIKIPDLSIEGIPENVYDWLYKQIEVKNLEKNRTNPNLKISNKILLDFKDDTSDSAYIAHYHVMIPEKFEKDHVIVRFDGNYIPSEKEYESWVNEEIIKYIKSKIEYFVFRDSLCSYFNSPICLCNNFQKNFYSTNYSLSQKDHMYKLGFDLNIPGLEKMDFDKAMEIRKNAHWSFVELQKKIKEDSNQLRAANDEKVYKDIIKQIENDYLNAIKSTHTILDSMKKLFSFNNLTNMVLAAHSYYTGQFSNVTTGLTVINGLYNAYDITKTQLSNPMYFLKKMMK